MAESGEKAEVDIKSVQNVNRQHFGSGLSTGEHNNYNEKTSEHQNILFFPWQYSASVHLINPQNMANTNKNNI